MSSSQDASSSLPSAPQQQQHHHHHRGGGGGRRRRGAAAVVEKNHSQQHDFPNIDVEKMITAGEKEFDEDRASNKDAPSIRGNKRQRLLLLTHQMPVVVTCRTLPLRFQTAIGAWRNDPHRVHTSIQWIRRHWRPCLMLVLSVPFILRPSRLWKWRYKYFGKHNIHGGDVGQKIEYYANLWVYQATVQRQKQALLDLGVMLPDEASSHQDKFRVLNIQTHAALREMLVRRERRGRLLVALEESAQANADRCTSRGKSCKVPIALFVPTDVVGVGGSSHWPRTGFLPAWPRLSYNPIEMRDLVEDTDSSLLPFYDGLSHVQDKIHVWSLCVIYQFGGLYVGPGQRMLSGLYSNDTESLDAMLLQRLDDVSTTQKQKQNTTTTANPYAKNSKLTTFATRVPVATVVLDRKQKANMTLPSIHLLFATPRHPILYCKLKSLKDESTRLHLWSSQVSDRILGCWRKLSFLTSCGRSGASKSPDLSCCGQLVQTEPDPDCSTLPEILRTNRENDAGAGSLELNVFFASNKKEKLPSQTPNPFTLFPQVTIKEKNTLVLNANQQLHHNQVAKTPLESRLQHQKSDPGWLCMRCVKLPTYGTMERCDQYCPRRYVEIVCHSPDLPNKEEVPVKITIRNSEPRSYEERRIPRIIHQTWFEQVDPDRYPQLARVKNSWQKRGWEYRFYTDKEARLYIIKHFPRHFVDAFDALIPGAYKADLFRYLVLLREGGVYSDVDILLEANLDDLITPSLSFFAPRDVVGEYADEAFCLWNGLIGAAPGHPFMIRAVERTVNLILDRADVFDMERDLCRHHTPEQARRLEMWKVRSQPLLLLSGPCSLGVAVNDALQRPSLQALPLGWMPLDQMSYAGKQQDHGDALILVVDKYDLGSFRISDPERDVVVASTNLDGLSKTARQPKHMTALQRKRQKSRQTGVHSHYSNATRGIFVWGSDGTYRDKMISKQRIKFVVHYEDV